MKRYWVRDSGMMEIPRAFTLEEKEKSDGWKIVILASEVDAERAKDKDKLNVAKSALEEIGDAALVAKTRNDCVHIALRALARIVELESEKDDENKIDIEPELPKPKMNLRR